MSTGDLWWKNAVIYCVDVETYYDSDGDGIGDLAGLTQRIDYLAELGVTCLWLMPFYPTPDRDDGYDVTDLFGVDSRLGTHGDLVELLRTANDRGIRVIADLVVNHTSAQHPWFKAARRSKDNPYRDYYVWRADPPPDTSDKVVFPDKEDSIWELDERTGEWYLHHFYSHQPDLNFANPEVRDHIAKSIGFWLELGLAGFRVDAVPFLIADVDTAGDDVPGDPHGYLKELRSFLGRRRGDAILLGEVNLPHKEQRAYFGGSDGDELTMMFDFIGMQGMYLALARQDARPLAKALKARPKIHPDCQWATFVRNHDELTLDKLSDEERQEVFAAFGPEPDMQIYGRGLKRRLPHHAGRRPAPHPHGLQPALQPAGHPDALLRRGDRDGRGPGGRGPDGGAYPDAVVAGSQRRLLHRSPAPPDPAAGARRLRPRARQRERPEARPRLAVDLHAHADPDLPRLSRAGLGRLPGAPAAAPGGPGAPLHLAGVVDRGAAQPVAPAGHHAARPGDRASRSGSTTCSPTSPSRPALAAP